MADTPKLSASRAFPWVALERLTRDEAHVQSVVARYLAIQPTTWRRLRALVRLDASDAIRVRAVAPSVFDVNAARCEVRVGGLVLRVLGASLGVRALVQRLGGGPDELAAPRPLGVTDHALWCLMVATVLEDLGVAGEVWPVTTTVRTSGSTTEAAGPMTDASLAIALDVELGTFRMSVVVQAPVAVAARLPHSRVGGGHASAMVPAWGDRVYFDPPVVVGRCALHRDDLCRLSVRSLVTLERPVTRRGVELELFDGAVGLAPHDGLSAEVVTGYVGRDMGLPDDAHVELTVTAGATRLSLRQITELAVGQIIQLSRPLAGPFELRAAGRILGRGELVDVDGELAVRIVSLGD